MVDQVCLSAMRQYPGPWFQPSSRRTWRPCSWEEPGGRSQQYFYLKYYISHIFKYYLSTLIFNIRLVWKPATLPRNQKLWILETSSEHYSCGFTEVSNFIIWGKSVRTFLSYARTCKHLDGHGANKNILFVFVLASIFLFCWIIKVFI